jgi:hypothetical protein
VKKQFPSKDRTFSEEERCQIPRVSIRGSGFGCDGIQTGCWGLKGGAEKEKDSSPRPSSPPGGEEGTLGRFLKKLGAMGQAQVYKLFTSARYTGAGGV